MCILHGKCNHTTKECKRFSELLECERKKITGGEGKKVRVLDNEDAGEDNKNKERSIYTCNNFYKDNPFFINGVFELKNIKILVDTGADVSIVDQSLLNPLERVESYIGVVKSACGYPMNIVGMVNNLKVNINDNVVKFSPLVVKQNLNYIILGVDAITRYIFLLNDTLNLKMVKPVRGICSTQTDVQGSLCIEKYGDIFKTEIGEFNICSGGCKQLKLMTVCRLNREIFGFQSTMKMQ